ncbi:pentatricopeptide repeat-containing protein DOT4, chloroplastic-like [Lycium barbarum]|uniref:pentatricopeptide repeat-containing protein DOT4, chloroplastic-like n=1 Tax=Lycium barbarum TaxID=112863 RepID=UPI00293E3831|nr:pentatricopeptide repeat-containing protein DOT4, chloroplastic-like [Lycium barbarum]
MKLYKKFSSMPATNVRPFLTFEINNLLQLCNNSKSIDQTKQTHQQIIIHGQTHNPFIITKLTQLYAEHDNINYAHNLFVELPQRNVFAWTAIISYFSRNTLFKECVNTYKEMKLDGILPDGYVFPLVLKICAKFLRLYIGVQVHRDIIVYGVEWNVQVNHSLIDMYSKCGDIQNAKRVFSLMQEKDLLSWNLIISGYVSNELLYLAVETFGLMSKEGCEPDIVTLNTVMDAYCRMGRCDEARKIFVLIKEPSIISWTTLISGYSRIGDHGSALNIFREMIDRREVCPDLDCFSSVLASCQLFGDLKSAKEIHAYGIKLESPFAFHRSSGPALLTLYAKCGRIQDARHVFELMDRTDVVAWNSMIHGFAELGMKDSTVQYFKEMLTIGIKINETTLSIVLPFCDLKYGKQIHAFVSRNSLWDDVTPVWNALIYMYSKCGCIGNALSVFSHLDHKDIVSWNTIIGGLGMHGLGQDALHLLEKMSHCGVQPNALTFTSVLSACSHSGLVDEGLDIFHRMVEEIGLKPRMEHFTCVVDLLTRAGRLEDATNFIGKMCVQPNKHIWGSVLAAALALQKVSVGVLASENLVELEPENPGHYVTLSNLYTKAGRISDALAVRKLMETKGLVKGFGCSWVVEGN